MSSRLDVQDGTGYVIRSTPHGIILASGTTVPSDGALDYAPGCMFVDVSGAKLYVNVGTKASANFDGVDTTA